MRSASKPLCDAYYTGFVAVVLACFSPFKMLAYGVPLAFTAWMLVARGNVTSRNRTFALACFALVLGVFYRFTAPEFLWANYVLALLTYSAAIPLLVIDSASIASRPLQARMARFCYGLLLVEGVYGIVQAVYGATQTGGFGGQNGDYVEGTLHPQLAAEKAGANPMFAVNIAVIIIACFATKGTFTRNRRLPLIAAVVALVLASVVHVLIFVVVAAVAAWFLTRAPRARRRTMAGRSTALAVTAAIVLGGIAMKRELSNVSSYAETVFDVDALTVPRAIMLYRVATELPEDAPLQPFIGLGPGQFCSRASLIASGIFLGGPDAPKSVPLFPQQSTALAKDYCAPLIIDFADKKDVIGSTQQPFFSWMSVYTELGITGLAAIMWWAARMLLRVRARVRNQPELRLEGFLFSTGIILFLLLGLQENYWELPQAVLVGLLLLKVMHANLFTDAKEGDRSSHRELVAPIPADPTP